MDRNGEQNKRLVFISQPLSKSNERVLQLPSIVIKNILHIMKILNVIEKQEFTQHTFLEGLIYSLTVEIEYRFYTSVKT